MWLIVSTNYLWGDLLITLIEIQRMYWPRPEHGSALRTGDFTCWIMCWYRGRNSLHLVIRISLSLTHIISNVIKKSVIERIVLPTRSSSLISASLINIIIKKNLAGKGLILSYTSRDTIFHWGSSDQELRAGARSRHHRWMCWLACFLGFEQISFLFNPGPLA